MTQLKFYVEVNKENEQCETTNYIHLKYISCGLAHEIVACFCSVCVTEKNGGKLTTHEANFQDDYALAVTNMTSQVMCFLTLSNIKHVYLCLK